MLREELLSATGLFQLLYQRPLTQDMHIKRLAVLDNRMSGIVSSRRATAQLHSVTEDVHDLSLAFVAPLRAENYGGHLSVADRRDALPFCLEDTLRVAIF